MRYVNKLVLISGETNFPFEALSIPKKFEANLKTGKIDKIIFTGNLGSSEYLEWLRRVSKNITMVRGEGDSVF